MIRADGRSAVELRPIKITRNYNINSAGSVLIEFGNTKVLCSASVMPGVPKWLLGKGTGWLTAEYAMLPAATQERTTRESVKGKIGGRTHEISRLIGRSIRAAVDLTVVGENTIMLDCDVLQADGGTRTAAITGAYVALVDALKVLAKQGRLNQGNPLISNVAAVSVGMINGEIVLDLPYTEDSRAEVDMNVVATEAQEFIEIQGTAEIKPFSKSTLDKLLDAALVGINQLIKLQNLALAEK